MASIVANLSEDGLIKEWQLNLFGKSNGAKLDASTFFVKQDPGDYIRIQMALDNLMFRASMASEWLSPDKYLWEYRLPNDTDTKKYYRVTVLQGSIDSQNCDVLNV